MAEQISLSEWLNDQLSEHNLSQSDLAKRAGVSRSVITKIAQNEYSNPSPKTCRGLAKALNVSPVSVFRMAGLLPPDPDLPEFDDIKTALVLLSPERRKESVAIVQALVRFEEKLNNPSSSE